MSTVEPGRCCRSPGEVVTDGLDGLRDRLAEYAEMGAAFAKWRAVIRISDGLPTDLGVAADAHALAHQEPTLLASR